MTTTPLTDLFPTPWAVEEQVIGVHGTSVIAVVDAGGRLVVSMPLCDSRGELYQQTLRVARLIAVGPELLAVCAALQELSHLNGDAEIEGELLLAVTEVAGVAVRKARG